MTEYDFSHLNLEYLIQARDLARQNLHGCALLLGIPEELAARLADVTPAGLSRVAAFKPPLVSPRLGDWWWERLLTALTDGDGDELQAVLEHASLITAG
ncbi:MAG: flagellar transcriptional regulator FlhD [Gammaproteobacteria bacterium]|nr:flagellar transcriptional regulator FlhD [Gammaproteobacteria bacterium]